jgi:hypothetical protein
MGALIKGKKEFGRGVVGRNIGGIKGNFLA